MFSPKMTLKKFRQGYGDLVGRDNLDNFFSHIWGLRYFWDKSVVEITSSYNRAIIVLVEEL